MQYIYKNLHTVYEQSKSLYSQEEEARAAAGAGASSSATARQATIKRNLAVFRGAEAE
jgi:hypothetical protein